MAALAASPLAARTPEPPRPPEVALPQGFSEGRTYDLGSLIDLGLSSHPATRAAWFQARAAAAAVGESKAPYYPRLDARFEGGADQWYTPAANAPDNFRRRQATTVLSIEYLLLDFGRRAADVRLALARFEAAGLSYERKLQQVVFDVQRRYFAYEAALWKQQAAAAMLDVASVLATTVKKETEHGLSATPELLDARKKVLEAEFELEQAGAIVRTALGDLCVAVGLPANAGLRVAKPEWPPPSGQLREKAGHLIEGALASRPDLAARAADVRASEAATRRAESAFFPEVKLEGRYAYSAFQYDARAGKMHGSYGEDINGYGGFLVASWDVFDGFARLEALRRRKEEERAARETLGQAKLDASRDVWAAYHETLSAASRVDYAEGFVASADESFQAARAAYEQGLCTVAEYTDSAAQLSLARSVRAGAVADYSTGLAALAFATGLPAVEEKPAPAPR